MKEHEALCNAIVKQAVLDYEQALCDNHRNSTPTTRAALKEVESYFKGDEIKWHTKLDGIQLMLDIKKQVIEFGYDLKALNRARRGFDNSEEGA